MSERGHVPFALVGVLLLVTSLAVSATLQAPAERGDVAVDSEIDRVTAETQTTLREVSLTAARNAASAPVTESADTPAGRVLREDRAFEDALRLRIYVRLREALSDLSVTRHGLTVEASLPETTTPAQLRSARDSVDVAPAGENGTTLAVTVEGIEIRATRDGRTVAERTLSPTVTVDSPVLAVHQHVETFEDDLRADMTERGLTQRLVAAVYTVAWTRGYVQNSGVPIQNVVANRHIALFTNQAALEYQRNAFGHSDPAGRATLRWATAETALTDVLAGTDNPAVGAIETVRNKGGLEQKPADSLAEFESHPEAPSPHDDRTIGVNGTADTVFLDYLDDLNDTLAATYTADVRVDVSTTKVEDRLVDPPASPGDGWRLRDETETVRTTVMAREGQRPATVGHWHHLRFYPREVELTRRFSRTWVRENATKRTTETSIETYAVDISLLGRHTNGPAPAGEITTAHDPGGPLDGPNLADVPGRAERQLVERRGGAGDIADRAVRNDHTVDTSIETVQGKYPDGLYRWVYSDTATLRREVANVTTTHSRGAVASLDANPAAHLRARLDSRREVFVDAPDTYDNTSHRAMVAARVAYLDRLDAWLAERAGEHAENERTLARRFPDDVDDPMGRLQYGAQHQPAEPPIAGDVHVPMRVETTPSYLTTEPVGHGKVSSLPPGREEHPLVVRNVNVVAVPYDDIASGVVDFLRGPDRTNPGTAARVLRAANASRNVTEPTAENPVFEESHRAVRHDVEDNVQFTRSAVVETLASYDLGTHESRHEAVTAALEPYGSVDQRALALANGSGSRAIRAEALDRWEGELTADEADRLALELDAAVAEATTTARHQPTEGDVDTLENRTKDMLHDVTTDYVGSRLENATNETVRAVTGKALTEFPKGVPVVTPNWVATVNFWTVQVRGEYAQFTVRAPHGSADRPGADLVYVRGDQQVLLDVDGDGSRERLGSTTRISFETAFPVVVGVPPNHRGVGDVDGDMHEASPGWPQPGPV